MNPLTRAALLSLVFVASACAPMYTGKSETLRADAFRTEPGWMSVKGVPELRQKTEVDCGPVALTMVTQYWQPAYERWVQMLAGMYRGAGRERVAWDSALLYDMIYTQPVVYELGALRMPVLLIIGDKDTTAIGKELASPEVRASLGNYPVLGKTAAAQIPHAKLVEFPDLGHSPQIQAPERFHKALLAWLQTPAATP